jgi:hypothetical protein
MTMWTALCLDHIEFQNHVRGVDFGHVRDNCAAQVGSATPAWTRVCSHCLCLSLAAYRFATREFSCIGCRVGSAYSRRYFVEHYNGHFVMVTNADGAQNYKIVQTPVQTPTKCVPLQWASECQQCV